MRLLVRRQHQRHVATFHPGLVLDLGCRTEGNDHIVEDLAAELWVGNFTTSELQGDLDLVAFLEELLEVPHLGVEIALADLGSELDLLHRDVDGLASGLLGLLRLLVPELPVVHDPAHRRVRHRCHFDQIEVETTSHPKRLRDRLDPELASVGTDQTDFTSPDSVVDTVLVALRRCYD